MPDVQLILVDPNGTLCQAFQTAFAELPNVTVIKGYFEHLPDFDCMVSAANSFGLMDGGVDAAITRFFGAQLERRVQQHILWFSCHTCLTHSWYCNQSNHRNLGYFET